MKPLYKTIVAAAISFSLVTGAGIKAEAASTNEVNQGELVYNRGTPEKFPGELADRDGFFHLASTRQEARQTTLTWTTNSTHEIASYHVELALGNNSWVADAFDAEDISGWHSQKWYTVKGLQPGVDYHVRLLGFTESGEIVGVRHLDLSTDALPALDAPDSLRTTRQTKERIVLNWRPVRHANEYVVERSINGSDFTLIAIEDDTWFVDGIEEHQGDVKPGMTYKYRVTAVNGFDRPNSSPSEVLTVNT